MISRIDFEVFKNALNQKGQLPIQIVSDSMEPLLKVSETLSVVPISSKIEIFDLVVFYQQQRLNCHFLWRDQKDFNNSIVTRSLKNPLQQDAPVTYDCILGVVPGKKISFITKAKILLKVFLRN